ncbi:MAG: hypothetical protein HP028_01090 [Clostridia bacterium]|jgi:hypothetical protein|nr:hypothetical protein [Clostridia bacterium]
MFQKELVGKYKMLLYKIWKNAQNMCRTLKIKYRRLLMDEYAKLKTKLQLGKNSNLNYIQEKDIDNIEEINVDINMPKKDRMIGFLKKVKNPYVFMVDGLKVKFEYSDKGLNINQCIENLIMNRTRI